MASNPDPADPNPSDPHQGSQIVSSDGIFQTTSNRVATGSDAIGESNGSAGESNGTTRVNHRASHRASGSGRGAQQLLKRKRNTELK
jgi:hypothetical protein